MRLVATAAGVEVVVPSRVPDAMVQTFVYQNRDWVLRQQRLLAERQARIPSGSWASMLQGGRVPLHGAPVPLRIEAAARRGAALRDEAIILRIPPQSDPASHEPLAAATLEGFLRRHAARCAAELVAIHAERHDLLPRTIRLRAQRGRWGSCGIHGDIQLNWRLVFAPLAVYEYVVVHELCHLRHRNHSSVFWSLVGTVLPGYERHRQWLREHGAALLLTGR